MIRTLAAIAALFVLFGFYSSSEASSYLSEFQHNLTTPTNTGHTFDLGGDRTVNEAFNSSAFTYDGTRF